MATQDRVKAVVLIGAIDVICRFNRACDNGAFGGDVYIIMLPSRKY